MQLRFIVYRCGAALHYLSAAVLLKLRYGYGHYVTDTERVAYSFGKLQWHLHNACKSPQCIAAKLIDLVNSPKLAVAQSRQHSS
jgi:hypothetical protein